MPVMITVGAVVICNGVVEGCGQVWLEWWNVVVGVRGVGDVMEY